MKITHKKKWIVVADGGMAKIIARDKVSFQIIDEIQSPYQHTPSKDIATDKDGNFYSGKHHSKGNSSGLHEQAETRFIYELSDKLEKQFYAGKFNQLSIIMPPKAMGKMRKALSKNIQIIVKDEHTKDLLYFSEHELFARLDRLIK